jgi:hypothetical protein
VGLIVFKPKLNILSCGIFAWAGKDFKKFDKAKFDIQGLYNNDRGGDSCGVSTDGEIYYGVGNFQKHYNQFIVEKNYKTPLLYPTVIGHTRKSSYGVINEHNAHPFGFGNIDGAGFSFIGCHNGTLINHKELAEKYNVDEDHYKQENGNFDRTKIDSEILLEGIYLSKDIKILNDYIGGAAIIFQDLSEPNIIYAYHGASRKETTDTDATIYEERPLYYYRETKNSLYISSIPEPLIAIGGELEKTVFEFDYNYVYKIENGDIDKCVKFKVDRSKSAHKRGYASSVSNHNQASAFHMGQNYSQMMNNRNSKKNRKNKKKLSDNTKVINIYDEVEDNFFKSKVYYKNLRYFRNGHKINGVWTFIKGYGFYFLSNDTTAAEKESYDLIERDFDLSSGTFIRVDKKVDKNNKNLFKPFPFNSEFPTLIYFHEGILLKDPLDYKVLTTEKSRTFTLSDLSYMSKYPLIYNITIRKPDLHQEIWLDGKAYTDTFSPTQSGKIYEVINGNLKSIEVCENISDIVDIPDNETPVIQLPISLNTCCNIDDQDDTEMLANLEQGLIGQYSPLTEENTLFTLHLESKVTEYFIKKNKFIEDEKIIDDELPLVNFDKESTDKINNLMTPIYVTVQNANIELKNIKNNDQASQLIDINKEYLMNIDDVVNTDNKN